MIKLLNNQWTTCAISDTNSWVSDEHASQKRIVWIHGQHILHDFTMKHSSIHLHTLYGIIYIYIWIYTRQQLRDPKFGIDMWWPKNPTNKRGLQCPLKETKTTIPSLRIQSHFCCWNIFQSRIPSTMALQPNTIDFPLEKPTMFPRKSRPQRKQRRARSLRANPTAKVPHGWQR